MRIFLIEHSLYFSLGVLIASFLFTLFLIPKIIKVVNHKQLMDKPNSRSSHKMLTPTFGGISFFIIVVFLLAFIQPVDFDNISLKLIASLTILLFTGLKDDLVILSASSKIIALIFAISIFIFPTEFHLINLHGFLGINKLPLSISLFFTFFTITLITNGLNLIDGIDGLASLVSIFILSIYSFLFYKTENLYYVFLCIALIGSLLGFLRFNLSTNKKIFMGDTGSLLLGFIISILSLKFLKLESSELITIPILPKNTILVVFSIIVFPLFDMIRVIIVRFKNKKHPFLADKSHSHHVLLDIGATHKKASFYISISSFLYTIIFIFICTKIDNNLILISFLLTSFVIFYLFFSRLNSKKNNKF